MKRAIIQIDQDLCNGCGQCAAACHESAIEMIDGKAHLVSDEYCDGLGNCLPQCPTGAITIVEKETVEYSEPAVQARQAALRRPQMQHPAESGHTCPGSQSRVLRPAFQRPSAAAGAPAAAPAAAPASELRQWPVQLKLVNVNAACFDDADLLIAADCTAYAYAGFHREFMQGRVTLIGCPKLDEVDYTEKLAQILANHTIRSIRVVRMEVPCCGGISAAVKRAMLASGTIVPFEDILLGINGSILTPNWRS